MPDRRTSARLRAWLPVVTWAALISLFSSGWFSGEHTGGWLLPLLRAMLPGATPEQLHALHAVIRKAAHLLEYAILAVLLMRALHDEGLRGAVLAATAMTLGVAYAGLDETHQAFVPSRTASPGDVAIDAIGVLIGIGLAVVRGAGAASPAAPRPVEN